MSSAQVSLAEGHQGRWVSCGNTVSVRDTPAVTGSGRDTGSRQAAGVSVAAARGVKVTVIPGLCFSSSRILLRVWRLGSCLV